ncbi:DUF1385 domain-containing protein [Myxococcota bacterium]|nr:DUF1385 domain-containing protein [Myxococcota bacterium]
MMRSANSFAVACRIPSGDMVIKEQRWKSLAVRFPFLKWPFFRGTVVLVEALLNGLSALTFSANIQARYEEKPAKGDETDASEVGKSPKESESKELSKGEAFVAISISLLFAMGLFVLLPHLATSLLGYDTDTLSFHLIDGLIKLVILLTYLWGIGFIADIRRVFQYHGAEHKAIFAHEKGLELTVENASRQTRFHPRCGTSFLFLVIGVSIVLFSLTLQFRIVDSKILDNIIKIIIKIPLMLPVAGIAYELIRISGKHHEKWYFKPFIAPGLALQRLTTREPDEKMVEVALASLKISLWREEHIEAPSDDKERFYKGLADVPETPIIMGN